MESKILFVNNEPALLVKKERCIVAGDMHIGIELKLMEKGINLPNLAEAMGKKLYGIAKSAGARRIVLLGDVKESIGYPVHEEEEALGNFFGSIRGIRVDVTRGNHDGHLERVFSSLGIDAGISDEILFEDAALLHGNAWPSEGAMQKDYIVVAHGHIAIDVGGVLSKAWLIAKAKNPEAEYEKYNRHARLVVAPPFNEMMVGSRISANTINYIPLLKRGVFGFESAELFSLDGASRGTVKSNIRAAST
ncbi:MAG: metallophosphoesterase [Candidatus Micrarchaeaceae archaeon]